MSEDTISRQAAIDAVKWGITYARAINTCTGETKELFKVSNHALNEAVERLKELPSAQPETCDTCKHGYFGDTQCDNCCVRYPSHYERRTDE